MTVPSCQSCANCVPANSGKLNDATCSAVTDPLTGAPLNARIARQETYANWVLPCGYKGALWKAKS